MLRGMRNKKFPLKKSPSSANGSSVRLYFQWICYKVEICHFFFSNRTTHFVILSIIRSLSPTTFIVDSCSNWYDVGKCFTDESVLR